MHKTRFFVVLLMLTLLTGCSPQKAGVSGIITIDGKPIPDHVVSFEPTDAKNPLDLIAVGTTNAEGRYTLANIKTKKPECPVGQCRVRVIWNNPDKGNSDSDEPSSRKPPVKLPDSASDGSMLFDVPPGGTDKADFDLKP